ncbi:MAG: EF-hand domain-containing protein [Rhodobacteraceae bacterium]|jgi:hypothetical protein|nr:EF-hand domain-containing protein [Paracoccaceae bacterium]
MALRGAAFWTAVPAVLAAAAVMAGGSAIDSDGDGSYSLEELQVFYPSLTEADYSKIDTDGSGSISPAEFRRGQDDGHLREPVSEG